MTEYMCRRITAVSLAFAAAFTLGACSSDSKKGPDSLGADSTLNRDLSLAGRDSTAQPQLKDVPASQPEATPPTRTASAPPRPRPNTPPRPAPSAPPVTTPSGNVVTTSPSGGTATGGGAVGTIAAGTTLALNSTSRICTNTNNVGDKVTATVSEAVNGSNGAVIPAGATVTLTVTKLKRSENVNDPVVMEFSVNSVSYGSCSVKPLGTATARSLRARRRWGPPTSSTTLWRSPAGRRLRMRAVWPMRAAICSDASR